MELNDEELMPSRVADFQSWIHWDSWLAFQQIVFEFYDVGSTDHAGQTSIGCMLKCSDELHIGLV